MQQVYLAEREQLIVHTPAGIVVVSSQTVGQNEHIYVTPGEDFKRRPRRSGATDIYERAS